MLIKNILRIPRIIIIIIFFIITFFVLIIILFSHNILYQKKTIIEGAAKDGFVNLIFFKEIIFKAKNNEFITDFNHIKIIDNQNILVDKFHNQQVYIVNQDGDSILKIGRKGQGPGEYIYPSVAGMSDGRIFIASSGTRRMEIYNREGEYVKSIAISLIGIINDILFFENKFYILCPTRYLKYSITVFDTLGHKLNEFSKIDSEFSNTFDTFYPNSSFTLNSNNREIYQVFNNKYEVRVFTANGNILKTYKFSSPFYKSPDYEKAKNVHGALAEKIFRSTFTQIVGIHFLKSNIFAIILRNWNNNQDFEDVVEFWNNKGFFLYRYKVKEGEELLASHNDALLFKKQNLTDNNSNPSVIIRKVQ